MRVVGRGLNVEMAVNATVGGHISEPTLTGTASVVGGDYEFAGKRFVFEEGGTVSLSTDPRLIRLNLAATRDDPALTATIRVTGTAVKPEIVLTSTPALPADEVRAILAGQPRYRIPLDRITWLPPLQNPSKAFGIGLNIFFKIGAVQILNRAASVLNDVARFGILCGYFSGCTQALCNGFGRAAWNEQARPLGILGVKA